MAGARASHFGRGRGAARVCSARGATMSRRAGGVPSDSALARSPATEMVRTSQQTRGARRLLADDGGASTNVIGRRTSAVNCITLARRFQCHFSGQRSSLSADGVFVFAFVECPAGPAPTALDICRLIASTNIVTPPLGPTERAPGPNQAHSVAAAAAAASAPPSGDSSSLIFEPSRGHRGGRARAAGEKRHGGMQPANLTARQPASPTAPQPHSPTAPQTDEQKGGLSGAHLGWPTQRAPLKFITRRRTVLICFALFEERTCLDPSPRPGQ